MMYDPEKSDFAIVAGKPTNKAGAAAAEPAVPRAGTERNADERSTRRTLSRDRVSSDLCGTSTPSVIPTPTD
jgi:RNA-directed DNA polymerase